MRPNKSGFSLVESLIAAVILVVTILLVARMVMNFKGSSRGLEGDLSCHTRAEAIIGAFKNLDNKTAIDNFQPCPNCNPTPYASAYSNLNHPERFYSPAVIPLGPTAPSTMTYNETNNWLLIDNGVNLALSLYNKKKLGGPDFCTSPVQFMGTGQVAGSWVIASNPTLNLQTVLSNVGAPLDQEKDFLQVQLYDLTTGQSVPCGSTSYLTPGYTIQRILPPGSLNVSAAPTPYPETKLGIKIKGIVQFVNQKGVQDQCFADTALRADGNTAGPQFLWDPQVIFADQLAGFANKVNCDEVHPYICIGERKAILNDYSGQYNYLTYPMTGQNPPRIMCGNSVTKGTTQFAVAVDEPGVSFGCYFKWSATQPQIDSATGVPGYAPPPASPPAGAAFQPCNGGVFSASGSTFTTSMTQITLGPSPVPLPTRPASAPSPATLTVSSGNVTAAEITTSNIPDGWYTIYIRAYDSAQNQSTVAQEFAVDNTRPNKIVPMGANYNFKPPPYIHYVPAPYSSPGLYQCKDSNNAQYWSASAINSSGVLDIAPTGGIWTIDGNVLNNGKCAAAALVPQGLAAGTHTVTAQACDDCFDRLSGGPLVPTSPVVSQTWTINLGPTCPTPTPAPSVSPTPAPTPTPTPFACCLGEISYCHGTGGTCAWTAPTQMNFFATGFVSVLIAPGDPMPNPAGTNYCNNQTNCSAAPNTDSSVACAVINPCPVLLPSLATCNYDYECASNSCITRVTGPATKECQ